MQNQKNNQKHRKAKPAAARELEKDVAKLSSNTGSSKVHVDDNEPPLAGQASG